MLKKKYCIAVGIGVLCLATLLFVAWREARHVRRDPNVLMNQFYHFKDKNPEAAKKALLIILQQDSQHVSALKELSQWMLHTPKPELAMDWLQQLHNIFPKNHQYSFQLGYLYYLNGEWHKAKRIFSHLQKQAAGALREQVLLAIQAMGSYIPYYQYHTTVETLAKPTRASTAITPTFSRKQAARHQPVATTFLPKSQTTSKGDNARLQWEQYYSLKKKDSEAAFRLIKAIAKLNPLQADTLREAGYLSIHKGRRIEAIDYLTRAYALTRKSDLALQLGYLYNTLNDKPAAYRYFTQAAQSPDKKIALCAENSLTNISGQQTKILPTPYFGEVYFNPFSQSRFGLTVLPFIGRMGIEQDNQLQTKEYFFLRRTSDNRSRNLGELSQLYEDDVQITGVGGQIKPLSKLPIVAFLETGVAYDLVYQNRNRWRGDLRAGLMYFEEWGAKPAYFETARLYPDYYSNWYADITYFSRYNNNVIGLIRTHQGVHILQYQRSLLNLYVTGRAITDTHREFFNNLAEIGPGIAFIPTNLLPLQIRFEQVKGVYIPAGASPNPYGKYYTNRVIQLLFYLKI